MNLPKAIELGNEAEKSLRDHKFPDHADAIKLLIEAGERVWLARKGANFIGGGLLPSETEE